MCNVVQLCLAANGVLLISKWNHLFLLHLITLTWKWQNGRYKLRDKIIKQYNYFKVGCHKISWFVSVAQINYLPQPLPLLADLLATDKSPYFAQAHPIIVTIVLKSHLSVNLFIHNVICGEHSKHERSMICPFSHWHSHMSSVNLQVSLNCYIVFVLLVETYRVLSCNSG